MTGVAALAICAAFTSCSKSDELYNPDVINQGKTESIVEKYNQAFLKYIGASSEADIPANQTWGFGGYAAGTRSGENASGATVLKHDMVSQGYPIDREPAALVEAHDGFKSEREYVTEWFQNNPGLTTEGLNVHNFFLQYVSGDDNNKEGNWYNPDGSLKQTFSANGGMDYLVVGASQTDNVHINDFNAKSGGPFGVIYVKNGSAMTFGYHSSYGEAQFSPTNDGCYYYFKLAKIDVPGVGEGWYVGLSLWAEKNDNGRQKLGEQRLQYAEDWILKIIPDEPIIEPDPDNVCIMAEDLSADGDTDFDWNDVVFTVEYTSTTTAKVTLFAAGGTLPLKVAGREVHDAFGYPNPDENGLYKMINTGAKADVNGVTPVVLFESLTVDKSLRGKDITITVDKGEKNAEGVYVPNWIELTATGGKPAAKVCVGVDFAIDHKWCEERQSIKKIYPKFSQWAIENPTLLWWR